MPSTKRGQSVLVGTLLMTAGVLILVVGLILNLSYSVLSSVVQQLVVLGISLLVATVGTLLVWRYAKWEKTLLVTSVIWLLIALVVVVGAMSLYNANMVAAWAQTLGLIAAIVAIGAVAVQVRGEKLSTGVQVLLDLDDKLHGERQRRNRRNAASTLLRFRQQGLHTNIPGDPAISGVLNYFHWVSLVTNNGALDTQMVWDKFYGRMRLYWYATKDYRQQRRQEYGDPALWREFDLLYPKLVAIERKTRSEYGEPNYDDHLSQAEIITGLEKEATLDVSDDCRTTCHREGSDSGVKTAGGTAETSEKVYPDAGNESDDPTGAKTTEAGTEVSCSESKKINSQLGSNPYEQVSVVLFDEEAGPHARVFKDSAGQTNVVILGENGNDRVRLVIRADNTVLEICE